MSALHSVNISVCSICRVFHLNSFVKQWTREQVTDNIRQMNL